MKIGIIGAGNIGQTICKLLMEEHYVELADNRSLPNTTKLDVLNHNDFKKFLEDKEIIINAGPHFLNKEISFRAMQENIAYFDLSEDVESSKYVKGLTETFGSFAMPQCGLAPGAVNIIANDLMKKFDTVNDVQLRVGALPMNPNNMMKYYLSWSTEGLVNEYSNLAEAIYDGEIVQVLPLDNLEKLNLKGHEYEAFSTSGGIANMCQQFQGKVKNLSYKTIRYPGHRDYMKFLLDDLNFKNNRELLVDIFNKSVPQTTQDVIIVYVNVIGYKGDKLVQENYYKEIFGDKEFSAIQLSTASGVCSIISLYAAGKFQGKSFISQNEVSFEDFTNNEYGKIYK